LKRERLVASLTAFVHSHLPGPLLLLCTPAAVPSVCSPEKHTALVSHYNVARGQEPCAGSKQSRVSQGIVGDTCDRKSSMTPSHLIHFVSTSRATCSYIMTSSLLSSSSWVRTRFSRRSLARTSATSRHCYDAVPIDHFLQSNSHKR